MNNRIKIPEIRKFGMNHDEKYFVKKISSPNSMGDSERLENTDTQSTGMSAYESMNVICNAKKTGK